MRRIIKASMEDRSSMERFQFSLRCAVCGFLWESQPVRFSKAGMQPESEGKRVIFRRCTGGSERKPSSGPPQRRWSISACVPFANGWFVTGVSCWARILTCVRTVRRSYRRAASR